MVRGGLYFIKEGALRLYTVNKDRSRDQKSHGFKFTLNMILLLCYPFSSRTLMERQ
jgi:hypothetical protein